MSHIQNVRALSPSSVRATNGLSAILLSSGRSESCRPHDLEPTLLAHLCRAGTNQRCPEHL